MNRHPTVTALAAFFDYGHLTGEAQRNTAARYHSLANELLADAHLDGPELTVALRKLLESKDCAVRASLDKTSIPPA